MSKVLPTKLNVDVLVDVVFEIRFSSKVPASDILSGLLFKQLGSVEKFEKLPASDIPKQIREKDKGLKYSPLSRVSLEGYRVNVGDNVLAVSCALPYAGWKQFKEYIEKAIAILFSAEVVEKIERYSLKYTDFLPLKNDGIDLNDLDAGLSIGGRDISNNSFDLRVEFKDEDFLHLLRIASNALSKNDNTGETQKGILLDVDSIETCSIVNPTIDYWQESLCERLEELHIHNKSMFFDCLSEKGLEMLEPCYE